MRLWHYELIEHLPQKQLCGQWRECIALLGNGWGKKHSTVNYVFEYPESYLVRYSYNIYREMKHRGYNADFTLVYKALNRRLPNKMVDFWLHHADVFGGRYNEHNDEYLQECLENLKEKGIILNVK